MVEMDLEVARAPWETVSGAQTSTAVSTTVAARVTLAAMV